MPYLKEGQDAVRPIDGIEILPLKVLDQLRRQNIFFRLDIPADIGGDRGPNLTLTNKDDYGLWGSLLHFAWGLIDEKELNRIQQHKEEENPRVSCAHGHQGGQERFEPAAGKRAKKACRLKTGQTVEKAL